MTQVKQAFLAVALVAAAGCAGTDQPRPGGAVSVPRAARPGADAPASPETPPGTVSQKEIDEAVSEISAALQFQDFELALTLSERILRRKPPAEARVQIERLRKVARQALIEKLYVNAVVTAERKRVTIGDRIKAQVQIVNVGRERVIVEDEAREPGQGSSRTLLKLEVRYREFVPDGTLVRETLTSNVLLGRRIVLEPGARHAMPVEIDTLEQNPGGSMLRHYDIAGTVFLAELRGGDEIVYGQLHVRPLRIEVFPRNWEHLAKEPIARLEEAIRKGSPPHIPIAAALVPEADRLAAFEILRRALEATDVEAAIKRACCVALAAMTGEDVPADPKTWLARLAEGVQ